jgi:hypothetical protein
VDYCVRCLPLAAVAVEYLVISISAKVVGELEVMAVVLLKRVLPILHKKSLICTWDKECASHWSQAKTDIPVNIPPNKSVN